jgi:hypothetical protein
MTPRLPRLSPCLAIAALFCGLATLAGAKSEEWKNAKGETFSASPSEVLGPWALFDDGTFVPLSLLSNEDSVRFYKKLKELDVPGRADDWKLAKSPVSAELYGRLLHYSGAELAPDNESGKPEPEFYIIFFTQADQNMSWNELQRSTPSLYANIVKAYPNMVQGVVFGVGDTVQDQFNISVNTKGDWMFTVFDTEVQMRTLTHMIPTNFYGVVAMTRNGVALAGPDSATDDQVKATFQTLTTLLQHMKPTDPKVWIARAHYFRAVQPVAFADGHSDPLLMGNPLVEATLRQMKIYKLDATFHVAADGKVTGVDVTPYDMPPATVKMFTDGFQRGTLFVPAVDHGKFVDGTYTYHMEIAP